RLASLLRLAGFQAITTGRFWAIPEGKRIEYPSRFQRVDRTFKAAPKNQPRAAEQLELGALPVAADEPGTYEKKPAGRRRTK
ncbi:MAG: hypothetical protein ACRERC_08640, partial [Candidatus Binatia bacterium]